MRLHFSIPLSLCALTLAAISAVPDASAAVSSWQKGASIVPNNQQDFGSESFKQSLRNLRDTNANYVSLVIPYYQSNAWSTDIGPGWNTPSDESVVSAIQYAHSLGMKVMLKPHLETYDGQWRAFINPGDRQAWFTSWGNVLRKYASMGQQHGAEALCIGTELISMTNPNVNGTNTQNWHSLIGSLRPLFSGALTYSAQHGPDGDGFLDEKNKIEFWGSLDFIGVSAYHNIAPWTDRPSLDTIKTAWGSWLDNQLGPLASRTGKSIVYTEVGYRNLQGANKEPAAYWAGGGPDTALQADLYEGLFAEGNERGYVAGVHWWDWKSNPNAGGPGDTDFTPQGKPAQAVMTRWFGQGGGSTPPPPPTPTPPPGPTLNCDAVGSNAFAACFFSNISLSGSPSHTRTDAYPLQMTVGGGSPHASVPSDQFSARWTGRFTFTNATYEFTVAGDDGVRLYIDGTKVIDGWTDQPETTYKLTRAMTAGEHEIRLEYYERFGNAVAKISWASVSAPTPPSPAPSPTPPPPSSVDCAPASGSFRSCFYPNTALDGSPNAGRNDAQIDFDWGGGSPMNGVNQDNFSMRSRGTFSFNSAPYMFTITADDGVRLLIDGQVVLDKWFDQAAATYTVTRNMPAGPHEVVVEYYERGGNAVIKAGWSEQSAVTPPPAPPPPPSPTPTPPPPPVSSSCPAPAAGAFTGCYFSDRDLGTFNFSRTDAYPIAFDWIGDSPGNGMSSDRYSVRWSGVFPFDGTYAFTATADDGVRLYIDGQLVIDKWIDQGPVPHEVQRTLNGDHLITMEYYEHSGNAIARLMWNKQ